MLRPVPFLTAVLLTLPSPGAAQEACADGRIGAVEIRNHSIFSPESLPPEGGLAWTYRLASAPHIRTTAAFIEGALLFREGDCLDPVALSEGARVLREYRFIASADVSAVEGAGGAPRVVVETRDEWTTRVRALLRIEEGVRFEGVSLFEGNLLGRGVTVGVFHVDRDERRDTGLAIQSPKIGGTSLDALLRVSRTRRGDAVEQGLFVPFHGEGTGPAFREWSYRRRDLLSFVLPEDDEFSHVVLPFEIERIELSSALRLGTPGRLYVAGGGISFERIDVGGADSAEGVRNGMRIGYDGVAREGGGW